MQTKKKSSAQKIFKHQEIAISAMSQISIEGLQPEQEAACLRAIHSIKSNSPVSDELMKCLPYACYSIIQPYEEARQLHNRKRSGVYNPAMKLALQKAGVKRGKYAKV